MRIFSDFHHGGLARAIFYLFADRLHHDLRFPALEFSQRDELKGIWGIMHPNFPVDIGGIPDATWEQYSGGVTYEEFQDTRWDLIIVSLPESLPLIQKILGNRFKGRMIAYSGNENMDFDWTVIRNLIATDETTYNNAPENVHKIWTAQELGRQYGQTFRAVSEEARWTINSFINDLKAYDNFHVIPHGLTFGKCPQCPHCRGLHPGECGPINICQIWRELHERLPDHLFFAYGHSNETYGGRNVLERHLPEMYASGALTWHMKPCEGYGHSLLQSVACGRPVIVPKRFYRYRTAGKYLIDGVTCFEAEWSAGAIAEIVLHVTASLESANRYARRCYEAARALFGFDHEAWRVQKWMASLK